jgi:hypothetical protein
MDSEGRLFHQEGAVWVEWKSLCDALLHLPISSISMGSLVATLLSSLQPVSIKRLSLSNQVKVTGPATLQLAPILEVPLTLDGWLLHFNQIEPHDAWILDELKVLGSVDDVANSI